MNWNLVKEEIEEIVLNVALFEYDNEGTDFKIKRAMHEYGHSKSEFINYNMGVERVGPNVTVEFAHKDHSEPGCVISIILGKKLKEKVEIISPEEIHTYAKDKGWWDNERPIPELLCLVHSEISEALEGYRNHVADGEKGCLAEELADAVFRIWDMSAALGIDIVKEVEKKHKTNLNRSYRHGGKRC